MLHPHEPSSERARRDTASMRRARATQLGMLPKAPVIPGLEIHTYYAACESLGGDFYDFIPVSPCELGVVIGDVSGHGVEAALLMAAAKKCVHIRGEGRSSPRETLLVAVEDLAQEIPASSFISIFYGILDFRTATLKYASAGHPPPLIINSAREPKIVELRSRGLVFNASVVKRLSEGLSEETLQLKRGDLLLLYTDGLIENRNASREQYGLKRLQSVLNQFADASAEDAGRALLSDVQNFRGEAARDDDHTHITLRYLDVKVSAPPASAAAETISNLHPDRTSLVGRESEVAELAAYLEKPGRLATLTGAAGIGKSRVALAAGRQLQPRYQGGAWLLELSECKQPQDVLRQAAQVLGIRPSADEDPAQAIISALRFRQPLLLILDNLEHLAKPGAELVRQWLEAVPQLSVLGTSRVLLGLAGEREFKLGPLALGGKAKAPADAVRLFAERAREIRPDFTLDGKPGELAQAICAGVDGIPLAIELAAARLRVATLEQVLGTLRKIPAGGTARAVSAASRRQTMFDAVAWSYGLLDDWEKSAFEQLCVFRGGFFIEDAEAVLDLSRFKPQDCMAAVSNLYDKNLLYGVDTAFGRCFHMYSAIRDYGVEQAAARMGAAERESLLRRHADYFGERGYRQFQLRYGRDAIEALDIIESQRENLMAVLDGAPALELSERAAQAAMALCWHQLERGSTHEAKAATERALKLKLAPASRHRLALLNVVARLWQGVDQTLLRDADTLVEQLARANDWLPFAEALCARASIHRCRADVDSALVDIERAEDAAKRGGAAAMPAIYLEWGRLHHLQAHYDPALEMVERAAAACKEHGNLIELIKVRSLKFTILGETALPPEALKLLDETEALGKLTRSKLVEARLASSRGMVLRRMGKLHESLEFHRRALETYKLMGDVAAIANEAAHRGNLYLVLGQPAKALECAEMALEVGQRLKNRQATGVYEYLSSRVLYRLGRFEEALKMVRQSNDLWRKLSAKSFWLLQVPTEALCLLRLGRFAEARGVMEEVLPEIGPTLQRDGPPDFLCSVVMGLIELAEGREKQARAALSRAQQIAKANNYTADCGALVVNSAWIEFEELLAKLPQSALRLVDETAAPRAPAKPTGPVRVKCASCGRVMIGPLKRFESTRACNHCNARPFSFSII